MRDKGGHILKSGSIDEELFQYIWNNNYTNLRNIYALRY